jgi:hypothetical protein
MLFQAIKGTDFIVKNINSSFEKYSLFNVDLCNFIKSFYSNLSEFYFEVLGIIKKRHMS